jgi:SOS-response transcriptional repressor LexA
LAAHSAEHPDIAASLNGLALLYTNQGKYEEAKHLFKQALAISEKAHGAEHPDIAASLNGLALLYTNQGKYEEAEQLYKRALAIREKTLGVEHPDVAATLNNLAVLYEGEGRYTEAEHLYERALAIYENVLGTEHPEVERIRNKLAMLYDEQSEYEEAEPCYLLDRPFDGAIKIPYYESVAASPPSIIDDQPTEYWYVHRSLLRRPQETILLRVIGDSMVDKGIFSKDVLIVEEVKDPKEIRNGTIIVASLINGSCVKEYHKTESTIELRSANKSQPEIPSVITVTPPVDHRDLWGRVTYSIHWHQGKYSIHKLM